MFDCHFIKPGGTLSLVNVSNPALWNIKHSPALFFSSPTVLDILVEVEKTLIEFANV
jgi:hypothetical protein